MYFLKGTPIRQGKWGTIFRRIQSYAYFNYFIEGWIKDRPCLITNDYYPRVKLIHNTVLELRYLLAFEKKNREIESLVTSSNYLSSCFHSIFASENYTNLLIPFSWQCKNLVKSMHKSREITLCVSFWRKISKRVNFSHFTVSLSIWNQCLLCLEYFSPPMRSRRGQRLTYLPPNKIFFSWGLLLRLESNFLEIDLDPWLL